MTELGGEDPDFADRIASNADVLKNAWEATIEDMKSMRDELEEAGWDVAWVGAGHVAPKGPTSDETDEWGLVHVIPNNYADDVEAAIETAEEGGDGFDRYEVYQSEQGGSVFQVLVCYDDPTETALLVAGSYELMYAQNLVDAAIGAEEMWTHLKLLDGTVVGRIHHDGYEAFFPNAKQRMGFKSADEDDEE